MTMTTTTKRVECVTCMGTGQLADPFEHVAMLCPVCDGHGATTQPELPAAATSSQTIARAA